MRQRCRTRSVSFIRSVSAGYQLLASPRMSERVSVVLPCLNEIASVAGVVEEAKDALCAAGGAGEGGVVDNGSAGGPARAATPGRGGRPRPGPRRPRGGGPR